MKRFKTAYVQPRLGCGVWSALWLSLCLAGCTEPPGSELNGSDPAGRLEAVTPETAVREISWEALVPEGEEERLIALYAESGDPLGVEEGSEDDIPVQLGSFSTVAALDGQMVRLPGYTVPLDYGTDIDIQEFLLVPYYGACLHLPPPPPNQTILVKSSVPIKLRDLDQAVWTEGVLRVSTEETALADVAYILELNEFEPY